jgi:hypothetical protein
MSGLMSSYCVKFAKVGDPNGPELPDCSSLIAANPEGDVV